MKKIIMGLLLVSLLVIAGCNNSTQVPPESSSGESQNEFKYYVTYETPEELYADFEAAVMNKDLEAFMQTLHGEAMENYGDQEGLDFTWYEVRGRTYDRFELIEDAWIWEGGEKIPIVAGHIWLKKQGKQSGKMLVMKVDNSWRVVDD